MPELMTLHEAAEQGLERVRDPNWANPLDHLKLDIRDGNRLGFWLQLYSPMNFTVNGRDPMAIGLTDRIVNADARTVVAYDGPLPDSDEYRATVERYDVNKCLQTALRELNPELAAWRAYLETPIPELGDRRAIDVAADDPQALLDHVRKLLAERLRG